MGGGGEDKAELLVKVVYTCTINYLPPQLLMFGTGTVVVTNPVKVVLVIGIVCVHVRECMHACACVCVCGGGGCTCIIIIIINIICKWLGSVIGREESEGVYITVYRCLHVESERT